MLNATILIAQIPTNDEPGSAIPIKVVPNGKAALIVKGTTANASATRQPHMVNKPSVCGCKTFVAASPNDVWYVIKTRSFKSIQLTVNSSKYFGAPGFLRLYKDISLNSQPVQCFCSSSSSKSLGTVTANNLLPNTTYYLAVSPIIGTDGFWGTFNINIFGSSDATYPYNSTIKDLNEKPNLNKKGNY